MAMVINTNIMSLNTQRQLSQSGSSVATAMARLSSGLRINSAKDDAAGLAISDRMTSQINGLNQAVRNANDGISLSQTAEGAMGESTNLLQRMRTLAIQSANASNSASDRSALQSEVNQLQSEISRIANTTTFNSINILDGTFGTQSFQVGSSANETIAVSIAGADTDDLGNNSYTLDTDTASEGTGSISAVFANAGAAAAAHPVEAQTLSINYSGGSQAVAVGDAVSAKGVATAINAETTTTGVSATASTSVTMDAVSAAGTVSFTLANSSGGSAAISAAISTTDFSNLADAINAESGKTGITAEIGASLTTLVLTHSGGEDINFQEFRHSTVDATITIDDPSANAIVLISGGAADAATTSDNATAVGTVVMNSNDAFSVSSSLANTAGSVVAAAADVSVGSSEQDVNSIDISTVVGSNNALAIIDSALSQISGMRADLGAIQNRMESTIANLSGISENVSAARSRIMDADFAAETAALTRAQILQQAGVAMLAQANAAPQNVLSLLQ
jgi:flagellin